MFRTILLDGAWFLYSEIEGSVELRLRCLVLFFYPGILLRVQTSRERMEFKS